MSHCRIEQTNKTRELFKNEFYLLAIGDIHMGHLWDGILMEKLVVFAKFALAM